MRNLLLALVLSAAALWPQTTQQHSIVLSWTDTSNPAGTQYNVYKGTGACSAAITFTKLTATPVTGLTFTDTAVVPFTTYCYYATATNGTVESAPSPQAGATALPYSPASLSITAK